MTEPARSPHPRQSGPAVLRLAASSPAELADRLRAVARGGRHPGQPDDPGLPCRLALLTPTPDRLALAQELVLRERSWAGPADLWYTTDPVLRPGRPGRVAFLFPGLSAHDRPPLDDVAGAFGLPGYQPDRTGTVGGRTWDLLHTGRLLDGALRRMGIRPDLVAGHSAGEWSALFSAGRWAAEAFDDFARRMGPDAYQLPDVAFAVVGCPVVEARRLIDGVADVVISHDNSPRQTVLCGTDAAIHSAFARIADPSVPRTVLPFRSGFHSPMLAPYLDPVAAILRAVPLRAATVPVWSATTVDRYPDDESALGRLLVRHLVSPVRFRELVQRLHDEGTRVFVQVGHGSLAAFVRDTLHGQRHVVVSASEGRPDGLAALARLAAALWVQGLRPDFAVLPGADDAAHPAGPPAPGAVDDPVLAAFQAVLDEVADASREVLGGWQRRHRGDRVRP
ncbi:acyltransferase domain-containing protein [Micromonospora sp. NPDC023814]|uniref:acyltransferase domain-containing protein n=1 Tax=Micromonospora sp. NPDC023814 TaxID=3154596 RepID=UPI00340A3897